MTPADLTLLDALLPRGRAKATSIKTLSRATGFDERKVRDGIKALIEQYRVPVVTGTTGASVFVAQTAEELDETLDHINSRAMSLLKRKRALRLCRESLAWKPQLF